MTKVILILTLGNDPVLDERAMVGTYTTKTDFVSQIVAGEWNISDKSYLHVIFVALPYRSDDPDLP